MCSVKQTKRTAATAVLATMMLAFWNGSDTPLRPGVSAAGPDGISAAPVPAGAVLNAYAELPLAFTENRGQTDTRVRYYTQGSGSAFFFTDDGIVIALDRPSNDAAGAAAARHAGAVRGGILPGSHSPLRATALSAAPVNPEGARAALALRFIGSNPDVKVEGSGPEAGRVHYLRGNDPRGWQTDLPRFSQVVYRELWPGIDLVLRGQAAELKYEFRVRPGANPSNVRLAYAGADSLSLDDRGALVIGTAIGPVRDAPPVSWQQIGGVRVPVHSRYLLGRGNSPVSSYGFALGAYDPDHELIIDPGLDYSTFLGGSSMDRGAGVAVDSAGNAYVVGTTQSVDFPTTTGAVDRSFSGGTTDVFVAKLNATGSGLVYATYLGGVPTPLRRGTGDNLESGRAIAVDAEGHAYVTGLTDSSDFPITSGAFQPALNATLDNATDAFVTKLNPSGSGLVYSTFLGGTSFDDGWSVALDGAGNAYVTGDTGSTDFPVTAGVAQTSRGGGRDAFVAKLNAAGSGLVYATYLGGLDNEVGNGIVVDAADTAYIVGGTRSVDFPSTPGAFRPSHSGGEFADLFDAFAIKLNGTGALVYSTFLGGTRIDIANGVDVDAGGNAYVVGSTSSPEFPTTAGAFDRTSLGGFVTKLNSDGSGVVYSTFLGGGGRSAIAVDSGNNAWVVGTASAGAPVTADAFAAQNSGGTDAWLGQLNADGSAVAFATFLGGGNTDNGNDLAIDGNGSVYIAGITLSFDFPTTSGAFDNTFSGDPSIFWGDAFVAKFGSGGGTVEPPETRTTTTFSGRLDKNRSATHTVQLGSAGLVDMSLNWTDSRAGLTLRVRDASGVEVFFDGSTARPKEGSFDAAHGGDYFFEVANTTDRRTDYTLSVTHPLVDTAPAGVSLLTLDPSTVEGGSTSTGRVSLTAAAPSGGAAVTLVSSNTAAATVPASVTVPAGLTSATFTVSTNTVSGSTTATISATYNGTSRSATLGVNAAGGPAMSALRLDPTTVQGGTASTGTATLTAAAPSGGAVVALVSSNTAVATVPASVTVPEGQLSVTFTVSTSTQEFNQSSAISASHGGVTKSVILSVTAGTAPSLSSLALNPTSVAGGDSSTGTVTLTAAAPLGGLAVALSSSNTAAATVPSSVTVGGGDTSATFTISTSTVSASTTSTISATYSGITRTATLGVTAVEAAAALSAVSLSPSSVTGGEGSVGTVTLTSAAPAGGFTVALSSSDPAATVASSVTVAEGATKATFGIVTSSVTASTTVTITASAGGVTRTATLTVAPAAQTATLTITATGRSGETVFSSPSGISVNVGSTGSASFAVGTSITLSVSDQRDAVWSGACSSGGEKTETCTFTLNGNVSVTANVQ